MKSVKPVEEMNFKQMNPVGELKQESRKANIAVLNEILANEFALFTKSLNFHWNITGPRFHSLHEFLEEQYKGLLEIMDEVAERVRVLGGRPLSTVEEMSLNHKLDEGQTEKLTANQMMEQLLHDHMLVQHQIKQVLEGSDHIEKDFGTEDFLTGLLQKHEMTSWMLNSHLEQH